MGPFELGDYVIFGGNRTKTLGVIVKLNIARAKVKSLEPRGSRPEGSLWNVNYGYMQLATQQDINSVMTPKTEHRRSDVEIFHEFQQIERALAGKSIQAPHKRRLEQELKGLTEELGRKPTDEEIWGISFQ